MKRTASLFTRVIALAALCCSLVFASAALTACGPDHEQAIRDALTQELDTIKNLDEGFINEIASQDEVATLQEFGIDPNEFFKSYLSGFDYSIGDVTVDGETATATVTLTLKSFNEFNESLTAAMDSLIADDSLVSLSEEDLYTRIGQSVMDAVNTLEPKQIEPLTISYELVDNEWTPTSDSQTQLDNALMNS